MKRLSQTPNLNPPEKPAPIVSESEVLSLLSKLSDLLTNKADKKTVDQIKAVMDKLSGNVNDLVAQLKKTGEYVRSLENKQTRSIEEVDALVSRIEDLPNHEGAINNLGTALSSLKEEISMAEIDSARIEDL